MVSSCLYLTALGESDHQLPAIQLETWVEFLAPGLSRSATQAVAGIWGVNLHTCGMVPKNMLPQKLAEIGNIRQVHFVANILEVMPLNACVHTHTSIHVVGDGHGHPLLKGCQYHPHSHGTKWKQQQGQ